MGRSRQRCRRAPGGALYPPEQYSACDTQLISLSKDLTALANTITGMQPNGNTNQAIGLQVGWQSLTAASLAQNYFLALFTNQAGRPHAERQNQSADRPGWG